MLDHIKWTGGPPLIISRMLHRAKSQAPGKVRWRYSPEIASMQIPEHIAAALEQPSVIVESLDGAGSFRANAEAPTYPASMIKVPIAVAAATVSDGGAITDPIFEIEERFMTSNDAPSPFVPSYSARVWELIEAMLIYSDNVATNALIDYVGRESATEICMRAGLKRTAVRRFLSGGLPRIADERSTGENEHPAIDAAKLFTRIARDQVPAAARLREILTRQYWNGKLSAGLRAGDVFAHKTGDTSDTSHDGGILTTAEGRRYVVVVYSRSPSNDETDARFAELMKALRVYL